jgi:oligopeptide/dipeptide ABC transporter ATP-binding protein
MSQQQAGLPGNIPSYAGADPFLLVEGLSKTFGSSADPIRAVDNVSFQVERGQTLALVGESGCGKSTTARCVLRLLEPTSGRVLLEGTDLAALKPTELRDLRRHMQIVFQDPYSSLDPRMTIEDIVEEPLRIHGERNAAERRRQAREILELVGISPDLGRRKPYAFSGGQRQRIAIARALILRPKLVVLDEPVTALDVSIQAQTLNLLEDLQTEFGLTYLFVVHDLAVAEHIGDRVAVMYLGAIVEIGSRERVFGSPQHPYTVALRSAVPVPDPRAAQLRNRILLTAEATAAGGSSRGCRFQPRCPLGRGRAVCEEREPVLQPADAGQLVACHFPGEMTLGRQAADGPAVSRTGGNEGNDAIANSGQ